MIQVHVIETYSEQIQHSVRQLSLQNILNQVKAKSNTNIAYVHIYCDQLLLESIQPWDLGQISWLRIFARSIKVASTNAEIKLP
jgi:hypothetical protein